MIKTSVVNGEAGQYMSATYEHQLPGSFGELRSTREFDGAIKT